MKHLRQTWPLFWKYLRTREGMGAILIAVGSGLAVGVAANLVGALWGALVDDRGDATAWVYVAYLLAFVLVGAAISVFGWLLRRGHGLAVFLPLFPPERTNKAWQKELGSHIRQEHGTVLEINAETIHPGRGRPSPWDISRLVRGLLEQRLTDAIHDGVATDVKIYAQAPLHEAFEIGRQLGHQRLRSLEVMHTPHGGDMQVTPGVRLNVALETLRTSDTHTHAEEIFGPSKPPRIKPITECEPESEHRLAAVVRLTGPAGMIDDVTQIVAPTGKVVRPDGSPTGYVLNPNPPHGVSPFEADGQPCGAYVVIEPVIPRIPENNDAFETVVAHVTQTIDTARKRWRKETGHSVTVLLFIAAPLAIVMGLGWLFRNENNVTVIEHHRDLPATLPTEA